MELTSKQKKEILGIIKLEVPLGKANPAPPIGPALGQKGLNIMDLTAFTLCKENKLPIIVFDMNTSGNLEKVVFGEGVGTTVEF